ncbi:putative protein ASPARTIC PROTEASE IN GUARD CELL 1 [Iris pallida]|uniref:Peptidase A1 domain-containing protein n=1 Tax=Iris pallida TaxID=29817 RepID=A0AAX6F5C1_IRIPA|nr:putative protein ASPARTIC PROTEASE IN GUARD CELL 1 [Iris pallida]
MAEIASLFLVFLFLFLFSPVISRNISPKLTTTLLDVSASLSRTTQVLSHSYQQEEEEEEEEIAKSVAEAGANLSLHLQLHSRDFLPYSNSTVPADYRALTLSRLARDSSRVAAIAARVASAMNGIKNSDLTPQQQQQYATESIQGPVTSGSSQGSGEYFSRVGIGSPARPLYLVLDTGSDVSWAQCQPCADCYQQSDPVFDPSASSTYSLSRLRLRPLQVSRRFLLPQRHLPLPGLVRRRLLHRRRLRHRDLHARKLAAAAGRRVRLRPRQRGPVRGRRGAPRPRRRRVVSSVADLRQVLLLLPRGQGLLLRLHPGLRRRRRITARAVLRRRVHLAAPQQQGRHVLLRRHERHRRRREAAVDTAVGVRHGRERRRRRHRGLRDRGHEAADGGLRRAPRRVRERHPRLAEGRRGGAVRHLLRPFVEDERGRADGGAEVRGREGAEAAGEELLDTGRLGRDVLFGLRADVVAAVDHRQCAAAGDEGHV